MARSATRSITSGSCAGGVEGARAFGDRPELYGVEVPAVQVTHRPDVGVPRRLVRGGTAGEAVDRKVGEPACADVPDGVVEAGRGANEVARVEVHGDRAVGLPDGHFRRTLEDEEHL